MKLCRVCHKPLNESQRVIYNGVRIKSCPRCSEINGKEHVYYKEDVFGFTDKRITLNNSDGIQSYCTPCRGDELNMLDKILCSQVR